MRSVKCHIIKRNIQDGDTNSLQALAQEITEWAENKGVEMVNVQPYIPPAIMIGGKKVQMVIATVLYIQAERAAAPDVDADQAVADMAPDAL